MDEFKYEQLTAILLEKITTLQSVNRFFEESNGELEKEIAKLKSDNACLRKKIEDGLHVNVTIKEEK